MKTQGSHTDVVFLSGVRTGFGTFGGSLNCATCASSNVTHFTFEMSMPWSSMRIPRIHAPVVTE